tara:strand:+ start:2280 stop:2534 length:255 start_codon:yes stop_codon:yes gene_type:complete
MKKGLSVKIHMTPRTYNYLVCLKNNPMKLTEWRNKISNSTHSSLLILGYIKCQEKTSYEGESLYYVSITKKGKERLKQLSESNL